MNNTEYLSVNYTTTYTFIKVYTNCIKIFAIPQSLQLDYLCTMCADAGDFSSEYKSSATYLSSTVFTQQTIHIHTQQLIY